MKKKIIIGLLIVCVVSIVVILNVGNANKGESGIPVKAVEVRKEDISAYVSTSGIVEAEESKLIYVEGEARIGIVKVKEGDSVKKGQVLATVDIEDLVNQLEQTKVNLAVEKLQLNKLKTENSIKDTITAEQDLKQAQNTYAYKQKDYEDNKTLYEQEVISQSDFEESKRQWEEAGIKVQRYKNILEKIHKDNEDIAKNTENEMAIQESKIRLAELKVRQLEKQYILLKDHITSPIDGVVTEAGIKDGQYAEKGHAAFTITNNDSLMVKVNVNEYDVGKLQVGQAVEITGNGLQHKEKYEGIIKSIASTAKRVKVGNAEETAVEVIIEVKDKDEYIKDGFSIQARIITKKAKDAMVVPYEVLIPEKDGKKAVYALREGTAKEIEVKTGIEADLIVQIEGDIQEGEQLIVNPQGSIKDGTKVTIMENKSKQGAEK